MELNKFMKYDATAINKLISLSRDEQSELLEYYTNQAREFLKKNYDMELTIPLSFSGQMKQRLGSFHSVFMSGNKNIPSEIKLNKTQVIMNYKFGTDYMLDTMYHELVHYALCVKGMDFHDGSKDFESELARLHVSASGSTRKSLIQTSTRGQAYSVKDIYSVFHRETKELIGNFDEPHTINVRAKYRDNSGLTYQTENNKQVPCYVQRVGFLIKIDLLED